MKDGFAFLFIIFVVSAISDIILNDLTKTKLANKLKIMHTLINYYKGKFILKCAVSAGLTIVVAAVILMFITHFIGFLAPTTWKQLLVSIVIAYAVGYTLDVAIYRSKIFGNALNDYYRVAGAGKWGAISFEVALITSFIIQHYFIPLLFC